MYRELFHPFRALALSLLAVLVLDSSSASPVGSNIQGKSVDAIFPQGMPGFCLNMCDMIKDICNDPDKPVCRFMEKPGCAYRCEKSSAASSVTNILSGSTMPLSSPDILPRVSNLPDLRRGNRPGSSQRRRDRSGPRSRPMARR